MKLWSEINIQILLIWKPESSAQDLKVHVVPDRKLGRVVVSFCLPGVWPLELGLEERAFSPGASMRMSESPLHLHFLLSPCSNCRPSSAPTGCLALRASPLPQMPRELSAPKPCSYLISHPHSELEGSCSDLSFPWASWDTEQLLALFHSARVSHTFWVIRNAPGLCLKTNSQRFWRLWVSKSGVRPGTCLADKYPQVILINRVFGNTSLCSVVGIWSIEDGGLVLHSWSVFGVILLALSCEGYRRNRVLLQVLYRMVSMIQYVSKY